MTMSGERIASTIRALRSGADAYERGDVELTADVMREAADMIESMNALLCDPDIVRKH